MTRWQRFELNKLPARDSIRVSPNGVSFGRNVFQEMGAPERVAIYIDREANAIRFEPAKDGYRVAAKPTPHTSAKVSKEMPCGRYDPTGSGEFVLAHRTMNKPDDL